MWEIKQIFDTWIHGNDNYNVKNDGIVTKFGVKNVINEQKFVVLFANMSYDTFI